MISVHDPFANGVTLNRSSFDYYHTLSKVISFQNKNKQNKDPSQAAAETLKEDSNTVEITAKTIGGSGAIAIFIGASAGVIFGPIVSLFLGLIFKFFQVIENLQNLSYLNILYGPLMQYIFDLLEMINVMPQLDSDSVIDPNKNQGELKVFNSNRGKFS